MKATKVSPRWENPQTVAGFRVGSPNEELLAFAASLPRPGRCLDIGCGAARNSLPLAALGFEVTGIDLSAPMIAAAGERKLVEGPTLSVDFILAAAGFEPLPATTLAEYNRPADAESYNDDAPTIYEGYFRKHNA